MKIYIPTIREHQKTLDILPDFLKSQVVLVNDVTTSAPDAYQRIKEMAEQIGEPYWIMDDDIFLLARRGFDLTQDKPWSFARATEDDWYDLVEEIMNLHGDNFEMITIAAAGQIPDSHRWPYKEGLVGFQWFCFSGRPINARWDVIPAPFNDIDFGMQMINEGYKVARLETFATKSPKACNDHRTIEASQKAVCERWPAYVKVKIHKMRKNDRAPTEPQVTKYFVKAYKAKQSNALNTKTAGESSDATTVSVPGESA
jgi:hypothetical protein